MMNNECGMKKEERGESNKGNVNLFLNFALFVICLIILVGCSSSQRTMVSTICGQGFHVLNTGNHGLGYSPNEQWILVDCVSTNSANKYIRAFRVDGKISWTIPLDNFSWIKSDSVAGLLSYYWSSDEKFVYLQPQTCCFDSTNHGVFVTSYGLFRLNLETGQFSTVIAGKNNDLSPFSVSISPDENYLVYVDLANQSNVVHIINLMTQDKETIELDRKYSDIGSFVWTVDNRKLIFVAVFAGWKSSSLYSLEMKSLTLVPIIENDSRLLFPTSKWDYQGKWGYWKNENTLFLSEFIVPKAWTVNLQTHVIEEDHSPDSPP